MRIVSISSHVAQASARTGCTVGQLDLIRYDRGFRPEKATSCSVQSSAAASPSEIPAYAFSAMTRETAVPSDVAPSGTSIVTDSPVVWISIAVVLSSAS